MTGIDVSATAILRARRQYSHIDFFVCDLRELERLAFPLHSFDLIVCSQVLYYFAWEEAAEILSKLEKLLKPDGVLLVAAHCSGGKYFTPEEFRLLMSERFE